MPEMDGIEACTQIKSLTSLKKTMIIFLSARSEDFTQIARYMKDRCESQNRVKVKIKISQRNKINRRTETTNGTYYFGNQCQDQKNKIDIFHSYFLFKRINYSLRRKKLDG